MGCFIAGIRITAIFTNIYTAINKGAKYTNFMIFNILSMRFHLFNALSLFYTERFLPKKKRLIQWQN